VRKIITADFKSVREKFIAKTFQTFKTVKKAFVEWKGSKSHIEFDRFKQMMESWGFANDCTELFNWLDNDKDGKISFSDLR
jgi:Ca2+-binding EF-hand superfamily protein